jgi:hypothetical protein
VTQTLTSAESGTGQEVTVTNEYWYSEALRLNLATKHNDPRRKCGDDGDADRP